MSEKIAYKILVADDHPIFRKGMIATLISEFTEYDFLEAEDGIIAKNILDQHQIGIAILDIDMPGKNGIELLKWLSQNPEIPTRPIVLTMHNDETIFNEAFDLGVKAYLVKDNSIEEIVHAINEVLSGRTYVSPILKNHLQNRNEFKKRNTELSNAITSLTKTEIKTLKLVAQNKSSKEIADLMFVTKKSIENYRSRICKKLQLPGESNALTKWALENKSIIDKF